ncbi:Dabb family protein [Thermostilla marina]
MLRTFVMVSLGIGLLAAANSAFADGEKAKKETEAGLLRHVVLFRFKADTKPEDIKAIEKAFAELPKKIPSIVGFEWGTDCSVEGLSDGFTHCFVVTFKDAKGREEYLPHPAHKAFVKLAGPHFDKVMVIDYVANKVK